ncbi:hypothetical protein [Bacillus cereus]|uniref:Uncharacterized protein n=1 Tax=Bacillus cereus HuA2-1 TaxID=1053201 RepID=J9BM61_BACCE|nr:hypothetical protein [Bacillus cereus]EJV74607.1 hypothetical protein IG3_05734 [Bacillus cereus HuA2-1]
MKKYLGLALVLGLTITGSPTIGSAEVQANPVVTPQKEILSEELIKEIKDNFTIGGILEETQIRLIEKIKRGEVLDAQNPEKVGTGYTQSKEYLDENGVFCTEKKTTYLDGSVTLETVTGGTVKKVKTTDKQEVISGGTSNTGSGYVNYYGRQVSRLSGTVRSTFKADYSLVNGGYDSLSKIYGASVSGLSSKNIAGFNIVKGTENSDSNAYGYLLFEGNPVGGNYSTFYHKIFVGGDTAWDTGNW